MVLGFSPDFIVGKVFGLEEKFWIASGICPQQRATARAPLAYFRKENPLPPTPENTEVGKKLYYQNARPTACKLCHGVRGNGNGKLAVGLDPPPRNFTCAQTMDGISDGQLFWVIKNGSSRTAMPARLEPFFVKL